MPDKFKKYAEQSLKEASERKKNKIVIEDIVDPLFVSPVVAIVDPIITKKSNRVKSAILRKDIQEKIDNVEKTLLETKKLLFGIKDHKKGVEVKKKYQQVLNQYESLLGNLDDGIKTIQRKKTA